MIETRPNEANMVGDVPEWFIGPLPYKEVRLLAFAGSNPAVSVSFRKERRFA